MPCGVQSDCRGVLLYACMRLCALLSYNEERQVKCRIAFQFAPETSI